MLRAARRVWVAAVVAAPCWIGCASAAPAAPPAPAAAAAAPAAAPVAAPSDGAATGHRELHLLVTTDEHGWLQPLEDKPAGVRRGGLLALWDRLLKVEGYAQGEPHRQQGYLLMSSGDMWTGPYETTVLEGAPMVAAMNQMGYAAASVGNHEFDFGTRVLAERAKAARFPFLAANLVETASGELPAWARPYTIVAVGGLKLGVLGFTNVESPVTSDPRHMTGLKFLPYAQALETWAPRLWQEGVDQIVVLLHDGMAEATALAPLFRKHRIHAVALGHHHHAGTHIEDGGTPGLDDDVVFCNGGSFLRGYCRFDLAFDAGRLTARVAVQKNVEAPLSEAPPTPDPALAVIVADAERSANQIGGEVLLQNVTHMKRGASGAIGQFVVDAWLEALPYATVAVTNAGGLRQDLPSGPLRVRDVVSVLPFNNYLLVVDLTGAQLQAVLENEESIVAGVRYRYRMDGGRRSVTEMRDASGKTIAPEQRLKVVINDFMYRGGDRYQFARYDTEPEETAIDWREPVLRKLREMGKAGQSLDVKPDERAKPQ